MEAHKESPQARLTHVLDYLELPRSSFYRKPVPKDQQKRKGPPPESIPEWMVELVCGLANQYPFWGYKRIAVICRRSGHAVSNKKSYRIFREHGLLHKKKTSKAEVYQAAKLFELLPQQANDLWQTDVTYIHIPGHGWWYAVTVIDYYSRYLLACHLTDSYSAAQCTKALDIARQRAEEIHGPLKKNPFLVTDNGTSFVAQRFRDHIKDTFSHVRIQYRTPTQLGLLERFHKTLKTEEVYYNLYENPAACRDSLDAYRDTYNNIRPHWALKPHKNADPVTPEDVYCHGKAVVIPKWQKWAKTAQERINTLMQEGSMVA